MLSGLQRASGSGSKIIGSLPISLYSDLEGRFPDANSPRPELVFIKKAILTDAAYGFAARWKPLAIVGPYWMDNPAKTSEVAVQLKAALAPLREVSVGSVVPGNDLSTRVEYLAWATTAGLTPLVLIPHVSYPWQWQLNQYNQHAVLADHQHYHLAGGYNHDFPLQDFPGWYSWGCELP